MTLANELKFTEIEALEKRIEELETKLAEAFAAITVLEDAATAPRLAVNEPHEGGSHV